VSDSGGAERWVGCQWMAALRREPPVEWTARLPLARLQSRRCSAKSSPGFRRQRMPVRGEGAEVSARGATCLWLFQLDSTRPHRQTVELPGGCSTLGAWPRRSLLVLLDSDTPHGADASIRRRATVRALLRIRLKRSEQAERPLLRWRTGISEAPGPGVAPPRLTGSRRSATAAHRDGQSGQHCRLGDKQHRATANGQRLERAARSLACATLQLARRGGHKLAPGRLSKTWQSCCRSAQDGGSWAVPVVLRGSRMRGVCGGNGQRRGSPRRSDHVGPSG
jgi:hypothetical protein